MKCACVLTLCLVIGSAAFAQRSPHDVVNEGFANATTFLAQMRAQVDQDQQQIAGLQQEIRAMKAEQKRLNDLKNSPAPEAAAPAQ